MPDILNDFPIKAPIGDVFRAVTSPQGLDEWWTKRSKGTPLLGSEYELWFGPEYDWRARVTKYSPPSVFELEMVGAGADWFGTRIGFELERAGAATQVRFYHHHLGWPEANEHYRISCHCWPMYLRILRRHLEHGESVPYEQRLDV